MEPIASPFCMSVNNPSYSITCDRSQMFCSISTCLIHILGNLSFFLKLVQTSLTYFRITTKQDLLILVLSLVDSFLELFCFHTA